jgi:hypothetical protein
MLALSGSVSSANRRGPRRRATIALGLLAVGALSARAAAQVPKSAPNPPATTAGAPSAAQTERDLNTYYHLSEHYTKGDTKEPGAIVQYQVGFEETIKSSELSRSGATTSRSVGSLRAVYSEQIAEIDFIGQISGVVRRYEKATTKQAVPQPMEGRTIWLEPRLGDLPLIVALDGKPLREEDYDFVAKQVFVPNLAEILPVTPVRIGDPWPLKQHGVLAIVGGSQVVDGKLEGRLQGPIVRPDPEKDERVATLDIGGFVTIGWRDPSLVPLRLAVRAQAKFTFTPTQDTSPTAITPGPTIDARGAITRLSVAWEGILGPARTRERPTNKLRRELIVERRLTPDEARLRNPTDKPPEADQANSWLVYEDPDKQYHFSHPQYLQLQPPNPEMGPTDLPGADRIVLAQRHPNGYDDRLILEISPQSQPNPEKFRKLLQSAQAKQGNRVQVGHAGYLSERDWPGLRVYWIQTALLPDPASGEPTNAPRIHVNTYLVQFPGKGGLIAKAGSAQAGSSFQSDVEKVIRSFAWASATKPR